MRFTMMTTYMVVILTTLLLMSIYIISVLGENLYKNEQIKLFEKANIISDSISTHVLDENISTVDNYLSQQLTGTGIRGIVVNPSFNVLVDSNKELVGNILMRDIIKSASEGAQSHTVLKDASDINMMTVAVPVIKKDTTDIIAVVYLVEALTETDKTIGFVRFNLYLFSALICILVGLLSFGMSYIVTSPVDEFTTIAKEISKGNFDKRVTVKGHNEFSNLAMAINYMCSELSNLEDNRKKFISDASHELKTPLATIKLICDSIVSTPDPDPEMIQDFLGDLSDEVDRLTRIVERLLKLTKIDSGKSAPNPVPTDITAMLNSVLKKLTPTANAKDIVLYSDYKITECAPLMLDFDKMWEAIYNITDNAIKYTDEGGFVKLGLNKEGKEIIIQIEDNGHGIPFEEQEHIFDRFYRLDDSRARDTGGTGLGLAIAKEAVILHGGRIEISSEPDMGSTFSIHLPATLECEKPETKI